MAPDTSTAIETIDALWAAFDRTYALFDDKRVPWEMVGRAFRSAAAGTTSEQELFDLAADMLGLLNDNHIKLTGWTSIMSAGGDLRRFDRVRDFSVGLIRKSYLASPVEVRLGGRISFGWLPGEVGYIQVTGMDDASASGDALDDALATFAESRGLVIDLRGNSGGEDPVGRALGSRFADRPRSYMTTRLKRGPERDDFTAPRQWSITPPPSGGYTRPVVVLTHALTFSAAENFVLALRVLPHVTVVGTATSGAMGETVNDVLPNGWVYRTVCQQIVDVEGRSWEGIGIPPDLMVVNSSADLSAGRDRQLDTALRLIKSTDERHFPLDESLERASRFVPMPLAESLAEWIDEQGVKAAMERFNRVRGDTSRWFLAEDWIYGDLVTLGSRLFREDRPDAAIAVLEAAADAYPRSYRPHMWLARVYRHLDREDTGEENLRFFGRVYGLRGQELVDRIGGADRDRTDDLLNAILGRWFAPLCLVQASDSVVYSYGCISSETYGTPSQRSVDASPIVKRGLSRAPGAALCRGIVEHAPRYGGGEDPHPCVLGRAWAGGDDGHVFGE